MITKQQLEENGYKLSTDTLKNQNEHYQGTYGKVFYDNDRTSFKVISNAYLLGEKS